MHPICSFVDNPYPKAKQSLVVASDLTTRVNKQTNRPYVKNSPFNLQKQTCGTVFV